MFTMFEQNSADFNADSSLLQPVEKFLKDRIMPIAEEIDEKDEIPREIYHELRDLGLMSMLIPQELNGSGLSMIAYSAILELVSKYSGGLALSLEAHNSLGLSHIYEFADEEQRMRFIPNIIESGNPVAWALSEPQSGSDAKNMLTTAVLKGSEYILNGSKIFITHGVYADYIVAIAKTANGISAFVVNGNSEGLSRSKLKGKFGMRGTDTATITMEDVHVPAENRLGNDGDGFRQTLSILDGGRIAIASIGTGIAQAALDSSLKYMNERTAFNATLSHFEALQFRVAELQTEIDAARLLTIRAAKLEDDKKPHKKEAAMAKYYSSKVAMEASDFAIQVHGGYGYFREFHVERYLRDAKLLEIGEGTTEVQKMVIFKEISK